MSTYWHVVSSIAIITLSSQWEGCLSTCSALLLKKVVVLCRISITTLSMAGMKPIQSGPRCSLCLFLIAGAILTKIGYYDITCNIYFHIPQSKFGRLITYCDAFCQHCRIIFWRLYFQGLMTLFLSGLSRMNEILRNPLDVSFVQAQTQTFTTTLLSPIGTSNFRHAFLRRCFVWPTTNLWEDSTRSGITLWTQLGWIWIVLKSCVCSMSSHCKRNSYSQYNQTVFKRWCRTLYIVPQREWKCG